MSRSSGTQTTSRPAGAAASSTRRWLLRAGAVGLGTVVGSGVVNAQAETSTPASQRPDWGGWLEGIDGGYVDARGQQQVTVRVGTQGNGGAFAFGPAGLWVDPGTTVEFRWTGDGGGHNVVAEEGPASLDSGDPVSNAGATYEYTFEEGGITTYFCDPHRSIGMLGAVAVGDDVPTVAYDPSAGEGDGGGGGFADAIANAPAGTPVLLLFYAFAGLGAFAVLGADYGGALYNWRERVRSVEVTETAETADAEPAVALGHDEFDPSGTLWLVLFYLGILVVMWVFMYFVEFLGRGATVGV